MRVEDHELGLGIKGEKRLRMLLLADGRVVLQRLLRVVEEWENLPEEDFERLRAGKGKEGE